MGRRLRTQIRSRGDQTEMLPLRRRLRQGARPAAALLVLAGLYMAAGERELRRVGGKRIRRELVHAGRARTNGDGGVLARVERDVLEFHLATLARMDAVEIERERVAELQLLVALEQPVLLDPARRRRIARKLG